MPIVNISGTAKPVGVMKAFLAGVSKPTTLTFLTSASAAPKESELEALRRRVEELETLVDKQEMEIVHLRETR